MTDMYLDSNIFAMDDVLIDVNSFLEPIVKTLLSEGGDLIMFTNSCLTIIWEVQDETDLPTQLYNIISACLYAQQNGSHTSQFMDSDLFSHCGIAIGDIRFIFVGDPVKNVLWYFSGSALDSSYTAYQNSERNNVTVSRPVWEQIAKYKSDFTWKMLEDDLVKIMKKEKIKKYKAPAGAEDVLFEEMEAFETENFDRILAFVHPLPRTAHTFQQVAILSCITQVCVGAAYLKNFDPQDLDKLQEAATILRTLIEKHEGVISKIMGVEGIIFGLYFGYPGFKHHNDPVRALLWAKDAVAKMKEIGIDLVVSLSTGMCFTGVVGLNYRFDCAIFGKPISYALKMVRVFCDISIICDISTVLRSRRDLGDIFEHAKRRTRGMQGIPMIYTVNFSKEKSEVEINCVGREYLKEQIIEVFEDIKANTSTNDSLPLIIISGVVGMGKTTLLKWIVQESQKLGFNPLADVASVYFEDPFERIWGIVRDILATNYFNTEVCIMEILGVKASSYPLHLLNKYLNTKFHQQYESSNEDSVSQIDMLTTLVKFVAHQKSKPIVLAIDDAEHMGKEGWLFLRDLLVDRAIVLVASFRDPIENWGFDRTLVADVIDQYSAKFELLPLSSEDIISLACNFLDVVAIHQSVSSILMRHSQGNPLRILEILLLPQIQRHFCLVKYKSVVLSTLEDSFTVAPNIPSEKEGLKVCDILDPEGLRKVYVPQKLLDVVKEHTSGLHPEEQMLIKKCAILGLRFGLYLMEIVCPEYTATSLRSTLAKLVDKNLLSLSCGHLKVEQRILRENLFDVELSQDFCDHPLTFTSKQFQKCTYEIMPQGQRERLHLFVVSLLNEANVGCVCESCRRYSGSQLLPARTNMDDITSLPMLSLSCCHCSDYKMSFYTQIDYHLKLGNAPASRRIKFLLQAAEAAIKAENQAKVETFLSMAEKLSEFHVVSAQKNLAPVDFSPALAECLMKRLRAQLCISLGNIKAAVTNITEAFAVFEICFPRDYLQTMEICGWRWRKLNAFEIERQRVIAKALTVGCSCLTTAGKMNEAYKVAKVLLQFVNKLETRAIGEKFPSLFDKLRTRMLLLVAGSKTRKKSLKHIQKHGSEIISMTSSALKSLAISTVDLRIIIRSRAVLTQVCFEHNELAKALDIGCRTYHMTKILHGKSESMWIVPILFMIHHHMNNNSRRFQMLEEMSDVLHSTGDILAEAMYHGILVLILRSLDNLEVRTDKMRMLNDFAMSKYTALLPIKSRSKKFWVTALIALWCHEHNIEENFELWKRAAMTLKEECCLNCFWSVSGALTLLVVELKEVEHKIVQQPAAKWEARVNALKKELLLIEAQAKYVAPVVMGKIDEIKAMFRRISEDDIS